jgi:hypothetical protein
MQRAAFPELQGRQRPSRHRRQDRPDRVLIGLKIATFLAACGVLGVIVLLAGGGSDSASPVGAPPKIIKGQLGDDAPQTIPTPVTPKAVVAPPALRTETAEITRTPSASKTPKPPRTAPPTTAPAPSLPSVGDPCPEPGMWSVTANYEPVFCYGNAPPRWRRVF